MKLVWITIDRVDPQRPVIVCNRCGERVDVPFDTPLGVPSSILSVFFQSHRGCNGTAPLPVPRRRGELATH